MKATPPKTKTPPCKRQTRSSVKQKTPPVMSKRKSPQQKSPRRTAYENLVDQPPWRKALEVLALAAAIVAVPMAVRSARRDCGADASGSGTGTRPSRRPTGSTTSRPTLRPPAEAVIAANKWIQRGGAIDGAAFGDGAGSSVALSSDGTILAVGAPYNSDGGDNAGRVRVFQWDDGTNAWAQRGGAINGAAAGDMAGHSVALSSDGTILAIGAPNNSDGGNKAGLVRVFQWDDGTNAWAQRGGAINGAAADDLAGTSVALSSDGTILAIGAPFQIYNNGDGRKRKTGHVRVFQWDDGVNAWTQRGGAINGSAGALGRSVALSSGGTILAVGTPYNNDSGRSGFSAGHVRVFQSNDGTNAWAQRGGAISCEAACDRDGRSVALSSDGTVLAVDASEKDDGLNAVHVRVFQWDDGANAWAQRSGTIHDAGTGDLAGRSITLSSNGTILAVGAPYIAGGQWAGHVRVFKWNDVTNVWAHRGGVADDRVVRSVSLSSDGTTLAMGAPYKNYGGGGVGHVRVFDWV